MPTCIIDYTHAPLKAMGFDIEDGKLDKLLVEVKKLGIRKKGPLAPEEFKELARKYADPSIS